MSTLRLLSRVVAGATMAIGVSSSAAPAAETTEPARDHVLFMGLDVALETDDQTSPIVGADHHAVQVMRDGRRVRLPIRAIPSFKTDVVPKVSREHAEIKILKAERCYTQRSDPQLNAMAQQMVMQTAQAAAEEVAARQMRLAIEAADAAAMGGATAMNPGGGAPSQQQSGELDAATSAYSETLANPIYDSFTAGEGMAAGPDQSDSYLLSFDLSSPERVENGYAIVRLFIRDPATSNRLVGAMRFFRLPTFGPKPTRVILLSEFLPPGFSIDRHQIHIYTNGREIPSNLSQNRVELSREEIFQFLLMQHMTAHADDTNVPVEIVPTLLANDLRDHVPAELMNRGVQVAVDANGNVTAIEMDRVEWNGPDAYIESVIRQTRFFPALRKGKPVADRARFVLSEFIR